MLTAQFTSWAQFHVYGLFFSQLSFNDRPNRKAMWIDCGIHAREWISPAFCLWFVHHVSPTELRCLRLFSVLCNRLHLFVRLSVFLLAVSSHHSVQDIIFKFCLMVDTSNSSRWFNFGANLVNPTVTPNVKVIQNCILPTASYGSQYIIL